jgi:hypothetical protein
MKFLDLVSTSKSRSKSLYQDRDLSRSIKIYKPGGVDLSRSRLKYKNPISTLKINETSPLRFKHCKHFKNSIYEHPVSPFARLHEKNIISEFEDALLSFFVCLFSDFGHKGSYKKHMQIAHGIDIPNSRLV